MGREDALQLLTELHDVQGRLDNPNPRLEERADEWRDRTPSNSRGWG